MFANRVALTGLLIAPLLISSCGEIPQKPVNEEVATITAGYGRAFGRIVYLEDGQETVWGSSLVKSESLTLFVRSVGSQEMQYMEIEGDGTFYWPHQAGEYEIVGYQVERTSVTTSRRTGRLMTKYSVPQAGQAVYIGELRIEGGRSRSGFEVIDRYSEALKRVEPQLTTGKLEPVKGLMRLEPQTGSYKEVRAICNKYWVLSCDQTYQGVEPSAPLGTGQGFPLTQNLTPLLEWKPSSKPGVTYDVAIFESLMLRHGWKGTPARLRGRLVAYAQGLHESKYSPPVPLQPGKRHEWTVRLREHDLVSTWSTTSYSMFAVVAAARGSGQNFGFETPGN